MGKVASILVGKLLGRTFGQKAGCRFIFLKALYPKVWNIVGTKGVVQSHTNGYKLYLDSRDFIITPCILGNHIWEPKETRAVKQLVKPGMYCLDIGAHVGYYTLLMSSLVGPKGVVVAFEPCNDTRELLIDNTQSAWNIRVLPYAVSDRYLEEVVIRRDNGTLASSNLYKGIEVNLCTSISLDEYFTERAHPVDFIKLDIEGSEPKAVRGMQSILEEDRPILMTEVAPDVLEEGGESVESYFSLLSNYFTSFYLPTKKGLEKLDPSFFIAKAREVRVLNIICSVKELEGEQS